MAFPHSHDVAGRVAAHVHAHAHAPASPHPSQTPPWSILRLPVWLRLGGGLALAIALWAVVLLAMR